MPPLIEQFEIKKINGNLIFTDFGGYESRNPSTFWSINEADKLYKWKDFDTITIYTSDCSDAESNYSYSKLNSNNNLIPDFHFHCWKEVGMNDYENFIKDIDESGLKPYKINKVGWVGSTASSDNRKTLLNIAKDNKMLFDCFENKWTRSSTLLNNSTNYIHTSDLVKKYSILIDIEGYGYSGRFKHLLWSHRPVLFVDRPYTEYFFEFLKEWEHYIPVKRDLSDLVEKTKWCMDNYDKALQIAKNAYEFSKIYLTREACYGWWNYTICNSSQYINMRAIEYERAKLEAYENEILERERLERVRIEENERIKLEEIERARIVRLGAAKLATARMLEAAKTKAIIEANIAAEKARLMLETEKKIIKIIEIVTEEAENISKTFSDAVKNEAKNTTTELMNNLKVDKIIVTKTKTLAKETAKKIQMSKHVSEIRTVMREVVGKVLTYEKDKFYADIIKAEKALAAEKALNKMTETVIQEADNIAFQIVIAVTTEAKHISTELMNLVNTDNSLVTMTTETSRMTASNILKTVDIEEINIIIRKELIEIASRVMFIADGDNNSNEVCGDKDTCN